MTEDEIGAEVAAVRGARAVGAAVRIVFDTNVVLPTLFWRGAPRRLLRMIRQRPRVFLFSSAALLAELPKLLIRPAQADRLAQIGYAADEMAADYIDAVELVASPVVKNLTFGTLA